MKKNIIVIFAILIGNLFAFAQRHEIGIQLGTSNLVGDIGKTKYFILFQKTFNKKTLFFALFFNELIFILPNP